MKKTFESERHNLSEWLKWADGNPEEGWMLVEYTKQIPPETYGQKITLTLVKPRTSGSISND